MHQAMTGRFAICRSFAGILLRSVSDLNDNITACWVIHNGNYSLPDPQQSRMPSLCDNAPAQ